MRGPVLTAVALAWLAVGCGDGQSGPGHDAGGGDGAVDAAGDVTSTAVPETGAQANGDAHVNDATVDASLDASSDGRMGAPADGSPEGSAGHDAAIDSAADTGGIATGDGGVPANQATSYLINPAHTNAVDDPSITPPLALAWTRTFATDTETYPLIAGGLVYLLVRIDGMADTQLVALDEATGVTRWGPIDMGQTFVRSDAYDSGRIFVVDLLDGTMRAFDATNGAPAWVTSVGAMTGAPNGPPTAFGGKVYVAVSGAVTALDERTGAPVWTEPVPGPSVSSPAVTEAGVFVTYGQCANAKAFDRATGATLWTYSGSCTGDGATSVAVSDGRLFLPQLTGGVVVLDEAMGVLLASYPGSAFPAFFGTTAVMNASPLSAIDLSTGRSAWSFAGDGELNGSPIIAGGTVFMGSTGGRMFGADLATGAQTWQEQVVTSNVPGPMGAGEGLLVTSFYGQIFAYRHQDVPDASVLDLTADGGCPSSGCLEPAAPFNTQGAASLALGATNVYWTSGSDGEIWAMPKAGGQATMLYSLANTYPSGIAVDANDVYWTVPNFPLQSPTTSVMKMPLGGGTPTPLVTNLDIPENIAVSSTTVFFTNASGTDGVLSVPIAGGDAGVVATATNGAGAIAVGPTSLYFSTDALYMVPLAGGTPVAIGPRATALAVDATDLYYVTTDANDVGVVARVPLGGGPSAMLVDGRQGGLLGVAVDEANVYWTEASGTVFQGAVAALPKSGGRVALLATGLGDPTGIAVDDTGVYFLSLGQIGKIAKRH